MIIKVDDITVKFPNKMADRIKDITIFVREMFAENPSFKNCKYIKIWETKRHDIAFKAINNED